MDIPRLSIDPATGSESDIALENPLLDYLGGRLVDWAPGRCELWLDIEPRHLNRAGDLHGGASATMLDAACGYAGLHTASDLTPASAVTVTLAISYLGRVQNGRIRARARVTGSGRRLYFAAAELVADDGRVVATAQGSFRRSAPAPGGA